MVRQDKMVRFVFVVVLLATLVAANSISFTHSVTAATTKTTVDAQVQVGGGTLSNPFFGYTPQNVEIKDGETVVWYVRPLVAAEPHTVTFVFDNKTMILGFVASNQRVFNPAIVESDDVTIIYPPNASLTITGTEKYVNSGWMFPAGPLPGSSSTFSVTFQEAGSYRYLCLLHPWMVGKVVVS